MAAWEAKCMASRFSLAPQLLPAVTPPSLFADQGFPFPLFFPAFMPFVGPFPFLGLDAANVGLAGTKRPAFQVVERPSESSASTGAPTAQHNHLRKHRRMSLYQGDSASRSSLTSCCGPPGDGAVTGAPSTPIADVSRGILDSDTALEPVTWAAEFQDLTCFDETPLISVGMASPVLAAATATRPLLDATLSPARAVARPRTPYPRCPSTPNPSTTQSCWEGAGASIGRTDSPCPAPYAMVAPVPGRGSAAAAAAATTSQQPVQPWGARGAQEVPGPSLQASGPAAAAPVHLQDRGNVHARPLPASACPALLSGWAPVPERERASGSLGKAPERAGGGGIRVPLHGASGAMVWLDAERYRAILRRRRQWAAARAPGHRTAAGAAPRDCDCDGDYKEEEEEGVADSQLVDQAGDANGADHDLHGCCCCFRSAQLGMDKKSGGSGCCGAGLGGHTLSSGPSTHWAVAVGPLYGDSAAAVASVAAAATAAPAAAASAAAAAAAAVAAAAAAAAAGELFGDGGDFTLRAALEAELRAVLAEETAGEETEEEEEEGISDLRASLNNCGDGRRR